MQNSKNVTKYASHVYKVDSFQDWATSIYNCSGGVISGFYSLAFRAVKDTIFSTKIADAENNLSPYSYKMKAGDYLLLMVEPQIKEQMFYTLPTGTKLPSLQSICTFSPIKAASLGKRIYPAFIKVIGSDEFDNSYTIVCDTDDGHTFGSFNSNMYNFKDTECIGLCAFNAHPITYNMRVRNKTKVYSLLGYDFNKSIDYAVYPGDTKEYYSFGHNKNSKISICFDTVTGEITEGTFDCFDISAMLGLFNKEWSTYQSVNLSGKSIPGKKRLIDEETRIATKMKTNILNPNIFTGAVPGLMSKTPYFKREVNAAELAEDIFQIDKGYIQNSDERSTGKGNPIIYVNSAADKKKMAPRYPTILFKDTMRDTLMTYPNKFTYALMNNCTYYGGRKDNRQLDKCFGITQEIDGMNNQQLEHLLNDCRAKKLPMPNYVTISKSKKGVHLYYLFDAPVSCQWWNNEQLKILKRGLCDILWKKPYSNVEPQNFQPFVQSFMLPGFIYGSPNGECTRTFSTDTPKYNPADLSKSIGYTWLEEKDARKKYNIYKDAKHDLSYAKEHWPKWYQKVVVEGRGGKTYTAGKGFYQWFLNKIYEKGAVAPGHRYYAVGALAIIAMKCEIPQSQLEEDASAVLGIFNADMYDEPFTKEDLKAAIKHFYNPKYIRTTRARLSEYSGIEMKKQKRNYKSRAEHMAEIQKIRNKKHSGNWRKTWGREKMVKEWAENAEQVNGKYNRSKCAEELHISRRIAAKYLKKIESAIIRAKLFSMGCSDECEVPKEFVDAINIARHDIPVEAVSNSDPPPQ